MVLVINMSAAAPPPPSTSSRSPSRVSSAASSSAASSLPMTYSADSDHPQQLPPPQPANYRGGTPSRRGPSPSPSSPSQALPPAYALQRSERSAGPNDGGASLATHETTEDSIEYHGHGGAGGSVHRGSTGGSREDHA